MIDLVKLIVIAGDGGNGRVSFLRERRLPKGGPDGGDGGNGGNVVIRGNRNLATFKHFTGNVLFEAQDGFPGAKRKMIGAKGEDLVLEVPIGTSIGVVAENRIGKKRRTFIGVTQLLRKDAVYKSKYFIEKEGQQIPDRDTDYLYTVSSEDEIEPDVQEVLTTIKNVDPIVVAEITEDGQEVVISQGGFGGRGNERFKSSINTTPFEAEYGTVGEKRAIVLELKLLADVGLVGFPNAGKSTLLSVVTKARPKIASYPFTTLEPNLGILDFGKMKENSGIQELVLADIPGLIEGASEGKGLGHDFLRHIENCSTLLFVLALDETQVFDATLTPSKQAKLLLDQLKKLQNELHKHKKILSNKKHVVSINKVDLYSNELLTAIQKVFAKAGIEIVLFSGATKLGLEELSNKLREVI